MITGNDTEFEQSADSDDLQQEAPEAGDVYIYILPVTVRSWFSDQTVLSVRSEHKVILQFGQEKQ